jgi:heat shock protein HslJ
MKPAAVPGASPAAKPQLSDTAWRLVEIQSMDDAVGTKRPDDRNRFTMQLRKDGTVAMQLDCNRANGTWTSEPSSDGSSGRFGFGPLAGTRALCPPPHLDERITSQAPFVRGYLLKGGRLHLTLMADGGILVWEPADIEAPFVATQDAALEAAVLAATPGYSKKVAAAAGANDAARYIHGRMDLNGDGRAEVFVFVTGSIFCGTGGCSLMLFSEDQGRYTLIKEFANSRPPVIVSPKRTRGWNDLIRVESGGGAGPVYVRHTFDGKTYVESERTPVGEVPPEGRRLLAGELGPKVGAPLVPRE